MVKKQSENPALISVFKADGFLKSIIYMICPKEVTTILKGDN